jgi:hypothetical protein
VTKVHSEWVNPEVVSKFGVACCDVTSDALIEPVAGEQAKRSG